MSTLAIEAAPIATSTRIEWLHVERCPSCARKPPRCKRLPESGYVFGDEHIDFPEGGIYVATCSACGLHFKTCLPSPESVARVLCRQAGKKWMEPYDFRDDVAELERLVDNDEVDLLDVGAGNGALLAAWARRPGRGRRSALDIVRHSCCADRVDGEYIDGLIDAEPLRWSGRPYDMVTMFDVLEHLFAPRSAFRNLRELVRDRGLVVIESGNTDSLWPTRYGIQHWWYARLFEHHVFWSRRSLEHIARRFGFQLLIWSERRHKSRAAGGAFHAANDAAQVALYRIAPRLYPQVAPLLGKYWTQPWSPFTRDHFRAVLRKM